MSAYEGAKALVVIGLVVGGVYGCNQMETDSKKAAVDAKKDKVMLKLADGGPLDKRSAADSNKIVSSVEDACEKMGMHCVTPTYNPETKIWSTTVSTESLRTNLGKAIEENCPHDTQNGAERCHVWLQELYDNLPGSPKPGVQTAGLK